MIDKGEKRLKKEKEKAAWKERNSFRRKSFADLKAQCEGHRDIETALERNKGDGGPNYGNKRNLDKNIEIAKKRRDEDRDKFAQQEWEKKVDDAIAAINRDMDKRGRDNAEIGPDDKLNGYSISFIRVPAENGNAEVKVNGRKAFVHEVVQGDSIIRFGSRTEVSLEMVRKAAEHMMAAGTQEWGKDLDNAGAYVGVEMSVSAGRGVVKVNNALKDGETKTTPGGLAVSKDLWDDAYASMQGKGKHKYAKTLPGGDVVTFSYAVDIDGDAAAIDKDKNAKEVNNDANNPSVSQAKWNSMYAKMRKSGKMMYSETRPDGSIVTARLIVKVNDKAASIDDSLPAGTVEDRPAVTEIGQRQWRTLCAQMLTSPDNKGAITLADGKRVTGNLTVKCNGDKAHVNIPMKKGEIREERGFCVISKDVYDGMIAEMDKNDSTLMEKENEDGKSIRIKREGKLKAVYIEPDGTKEVFQEEDELRQVIGEVAGFNDELCIPRKIFGFDEQAVGKMLSDAGSQMKLQFARSAAIGVISVPGKAKNGIKMQAKEGQQALLSVGRGWFAKIMQAGLLRG